MIQACILLLKDLSLYYLGLLKAKRPILLAKRPTFLAKHTLPQFWIFTLPFRFPCDNFVAHIFKELPVLSEKSFAA